jgi:hypothetical protein
MKIKVWKEFPYTPTPALYSPFTIAFCYPVMGPPGIVKGCNKDVVNYIRKLNTPVICHFTWWRRKQKSSFIKDFGFPKQYLFYCFSSKPWKYSENRKYFWFGIKEYDSVGKEKRSFKIEVRRVPRCFPKQIRTFIT